MRGVVATYNPGVLLDDVPLDEVERDVSQREGAFSRWEITSEAPKVLFLGFTTSPHHSRISNSRARSRLFSSILLMQISRVLRAHSSAIWICSAVGDGEAAFN